ncbi:ROK family protein [Rugosimonospora africana]|uniref:Sugar kinase n=1 Tax=Rugosimonospora africana TaxID=556532 RepID=A0A8J3QMS7_9ACTN|nr:ROK family protein [Rugosimonospora africana]GIH13829.1 sugar kinase [Rugosimonospora africana]
MSEPAFDAAGPVAIAVDVGGTKAAVALVNAAGEVFDHQVIPTPGGELIDRLRRLVARVAEPVGLDRVVGIGICSAGPVDLAAGTVIPVNIPELHGAPLLARLADLVPGRPARLVGDGPATAAGEHWLGAGRGCDDLLAIVVSTGIGGGLILGGRLHGGASGNAGHVGHAPVVVDGERCQCGGRGCPEAYASGPSMVRWALANGWRPRDTADAVELAASARAGDETAVAAFERSGRVLGAMIAAAAATCDLARVIIGGGVSQAGELLMAPLRRSLADHAALPFIRRIEVVGARLGPRASLMGAAALIHDAEAYTADGRVTATLVAA